MGNFLSSYTNNEILGFCVLSLICLYNWRNMLPKIGCTLMLAATHKYIIQHVPQIYIDIFNYSSQIISIGFLAAMFSVSITTNPHTIHNPHTIPDSNFTNSTI